MTKNIEVDDDVFKFLEDNSKGFFDTPNRTLRRLLGMVGEIENRADDEPETNDNDSEKSAPVKRREARTDLKELVLYGFLKENEPLTLYGDDGRPIPNSEAHVENGYLKWNQDFYSMSPLAIKLFEEKTGIRHKSLRGPLYWRNAEGKSVKALWEEYLKMLREKLGASQEKQ